MADIDVSSLSRSMNAIAGEISSLSASIDVVDSKVARVGSEVGLVSTRVDTVDMRLGKLYDEFHDFIDQTQRNHNLQMAKTALVEIRQRLDKEFGHYDVLRRMTIGILQADDLGIVRQSTITAATEETMIQSPSYWLAPCLVALSAWIDDDKDLATRALKEALKRDDEKTSLFFALVCRRAARKSVTLAWLKRYFDNQNEHELDWKFVIVLDAFTAGLFGVDTEHLVLGSMEEWLRKLEDEPDFAENQSRRWMAAIENVKEPLGEAGYVYLPRYSPTWPRIEAALEGANLHGQLFAYFTAILDEPLPQESLRTQLDGILKKLVEDFDEEELDLRKEERLNALILENGGDKSAATQSLSVESGTFETRRDFMQYLTDAAMHPEGSHAGPSTQKFAVALSRPWILDAYRDVAARDRAGVPHEIAIEVRTDDNETIFSDSTVDGTDEAAIVARFSASVDQEEQRRLEAVKFSSTGKISIAIAAVLAVFAIVMLFSVPVMSLLMLAGTGVAAYKAYREYKAIDTTKADVSEQMRKRKEAGTGILRATLAEVVDFRREYAAKNSEGDKVEDLLENMDSSQYLHRLEGSSRRVRTEA